MSELGVRASHEAWMRLKRRAAGGAVNGYDAGGVPEFMQRDEEPEPVTENVEGQGSPATPVGWKPGEPIPELEALRQQQQFQPFNPMQPGGGKVWSQNAPAPIGPPTGSSVGFANEAPGAAGALGRGGLEKAQAAAARASGARLPVAGLPQGPFTLEGKPYLAGPNAKLHDIAEDYMRGAGLDPSSLPQTFQKVDKDRAGRIAQAYDAMKHDPTDPTVRASYDAMIDETLAQYQAIKNAGIKFEFIKPDQKDPYEESPRLAAKDVAENNHLWVFPTAQGFGTVSKEELANNPLLRPTNEVIDGHRLLANDVFRIVHDVFGHLKDGNGFRAEGEEHAWRSHSAMYSDAARPAMTSETRGQNSWLNYGPHGDTNRNAKSADTVYADQKVGLLPPWAIEEGRADPAPWAHPDAGPQVSGLNVRADVPNMSSIGSSMTNYTTLPGIKEVPMSMFNTNPPKFYSTTEEARTRRLADQIATSGEINPLIVAHEEQNPKAGPYILEGGHRFDALKLLGKKTFPAKVVVDHGDEPIKRAAGGRVVDGKITRDAFGYIEPVTGERRCHTCDHRGEPGECLLFEKLNAAFPKLFSLNAHVDPHGYCNAYATRKPVEPTEAQAEAGNYRKGHVRIDGLDISIENMRGSTRRGTGRDGKPWKVTMPAHYGYIKRTEGADGDHVDTYLGKHPASPHVFVVNQHDAETGHFDEHKVMLGYASRAQAERDYDKGFSDGKGPKRRHSIVEMSIDQFKERLKDPKAFKKSLKRAAGGRIGFADGGDPEPLPPFDPAQPSTPAGLPDFDPAQPHTEIQETPEERRQRIRTEPFTSFLGDLAGDVVGPIWSGAKRAYETARQAGAGELDPSTPAGADKLIGDVMPYVLPMSPAAGTTRAIARAQGLGKPPPAAGVAPATVTAEAVARQKAADEFGIDLSRGQATRDLGDIRFEDQASRGGYGNPAQQVAAPFFEQQFGQIGAAREDIGRGLARDQNVTATPAESAGIVNTQVGDAAARARAMRDEAARQAQQDADALRMTTLARGAALDRQIRGGTPAIEGARDAGEAVGQGVTAAAQAARAAYQARYGVVRDTEGEFAPGAFVGAGNRVQNQLTLAADPVIIDDVTTPMASRAIRDLDTNVRGMRFQNRADPFGRDQMVGQYDPVTDPRVQAVDLAGVDQARKRLVTMYQAARRSGNATDARATGRVIDAFDDQVENAVANGLFSGDPAALGVLQDARAAYRQYAQTFRPQGAGDDVGMAMRRIVDRQATPEEIANMVIGSGRIGNAGLPVRLADRLENVLGAGSNAWGAIRQAMWQRASQVRNQAGEIDPARSAQSIIDFSNSSLGQRMFSPAERTAMQAHATAVRNIEQMIDRLPSTARAQQAQNIYEQAFGGVGIGGPQQAAFRRIVEGTATPEETAGAIFNSIAGGNPGNTVRLIQAVQRIAGPQSDAMAAIRQGVWQKLTSQPLGKDQPGQQRLVQSISEFLNGKGAGIAKSLYSDNERFLMQRYADAVRNTIIPKYSRTNSDTAVAAGNMIARYGGALQTLLRAGAHMVLGHGPIGWLGGHVVSNMIENASTKAEQVGSAKRVGQQFDWLSNASPAPPAPRLIPQASPAIASRLLAPPVTRMLPDLRGTSGAVPASAQNNQSP